MDRDNNRKFEMPIYAGFFILAIVLVLLDKVRARSYTDLPWLDFKMAVDVVLNLLPFTVLFACNNYLLIPKLLKRGRYALYFAVALLLVVAVWLWQLTQFHDFLSHLDDPESFIPPHPGPKPLLPLPLFLNFIYDLLIVGVNLAISLLFQHFDDTLEQERLMKENVETQLTYLKAQINPHFYMNMLNNIHGMIDIQPQKAQDMVIELSGLMRYMLYDSSQPELELASEVNFIHNYLSIMRDRYPEDAVDFSVNLPDRNQIVGIKVPPLLFLVFLENAFKHGISYSGGAFISVSLTVSGGQILFTCVNSVSKVESSSLRKGIGLVNVKRRMDIIYGNCYGLDIKSDADTYSVKLKLPYEIKNTDNR